MKRLPQTGVDFSGSSLADLVLGPCFLLLEKILEP